MLIFIIIFLVLFIIEFLYLKFTLLKKRSRVPEFLNPNILPKITEGGVIFIPAIFLFCLFFYGDIDYTLSYFF